MKSYVKTHFLILVACGALSGHATVFVGQVAELSGIGNANENSLGARLWFW